MKLTVGYRCVKDAAGGQSPVASGGAFCDLKAALEVGLSRPPFQRPDPGPFGPERLDLPSQPPAGAPRTWPTDPAVPCPPPLAARRPVGCSPCRVMLSATTAPPVAPRDLAGRLSCPAPVFVEFWRWNQRPCAWLESRNRRHRSDDRGQRATRAWSRRLPPIRNETHVRRRRRRQAQRQRSGRSVHAEWARGQPATLNLAERHQFAADNIKSAARVQRSSAIATSPTIFSDF